MAWTKFVGHCLMVVQRCSHEYLDWTPYIYIYVVESKVVSMSPNLLIRT